MLHFHFRRTGIGYVEVRLAFVEKLGAALETLKVAQLNFHALKQNANAISAAPVQGDFLIGVMDDGLAWAAGRSTLDHALVAVGLFVHCHHSAHCSEAAAVFAESRRGNAITALLA